MKYPDGGASRCHQELPSATNIYIWLTVTPTGPNSKVHKTNN